MKNIHTLLLVALAICFNSTFAQSIELEQVPGPISSEAFDLHIDKNGLLWIAHNGGISSYDGRNYRHYTNPEQISPGMSGLCEDSRGRIWCYNFNGQVWYVEKGQLKLLREYEYEKEPYFPRMDMWEDLLLIPSTRGLFIFDTKTEKGKYITLSAGVSGVAILQDHAILLSSTGKNNSLKHKWYSFNKKDESVQLIHEVKGYPSRSPIILQKTVVNNQVFIIQNPETYVTRSFLRDRLLIRNDSVHFSTFVNTVTEDRGTVWIHGKAYSSTWDRSQTISGKNLSDIVTDQQGNTWASSLSFGLLKAKKSAPQSLERILGVLPVNHITSVLNSGYKNLLIAGTATGEVIVFNAISLKPIHKFDFGAGGSIERLFRGQNGEMFIAYSLGLQSYHVPTKRVSKILTGVTAKDIYINKKNFIVATSTHLFWKPLSQSSLSEALRLINQQFPSLSLKDTFQGFLQKSPLRSNGACLINDSVFFNSTKTGVFKTTPSGSQQLYLNGRPVYASGILPNNNKLLISSFTEGLLLWENDSIRKITAPGNSILYGITKLKQAGNQIFVFTQTGLFLFNSVSRELTHFKLPGFDDSDITDLEYIDNHYYLVTKRGSFFISGTFEKPKNNTAIASLYCVVKGADTIHSEKFTLSHDQNNLSFHFTFPWYDAESEIDLVYRLNSSHKSDTTWQHASSSLDYLNLPALEPGDYMLEIKFINNYSREESKSIKWRFTITPPWWKSSWFLFAVLIAASLLIYLWAKNRFRQKLILQQQAYEKKLAVEQERNRISKEMHDDIGAGLSGISLLTEITKAETNDPKTARDLEKVTISLGEIAGRMKEVIWSLTTSNDNLSSLFSFLQKQVKLQLDNFPCTLTVVADQMIPDAEVRGDARRNIYLAVKEAVNNIIKHSDADTVNIDFSFSGNTIKIQIEDNGIGFDTGHKQAEGNGLLNMKQRIEETGGVLQLSSSNKGTIITMYIPLNIPT